MVERPVGYIGDRSVMYKFRIVGSREVVEVDFQTMMGMDAAGFITLPDGREARRIRTSSRKSRKEAIASAIPPAMVSDAMGFPSRQLPEYDAYRRAHGFSSVEYKPDPQVPGFTQVHFNNHAERDRYIKEFGYTDRNGRNGGGAILTQSMLEKTMQRVAS